MKKATNIFLLVYYVFGTFCLPMSNFAIVADLPQMFEHCKNTEDKDLTAVDFVTDHLLNFDGVFDKHDNGDEQKPHKNPDATFHITFIQIFQKPEIFTFHKKPNVINTLKISNFKDTSYFHLYSTSIFRPPILV